MYKQAIAETGAASDRCRSDYSAGRCTFYELQHALRVLGETRRALVFDAYEECELNWKVDEEQALQDHEDRRVELPDAYHKGFVDAMAAVAKANGGLKFNP